MAIFRNVGRTNNAVDRSFFKVLQILKRHWIGYFEWKIIVTYDRQLTRLKNAKLYGKRKKSSLFSVDTASRFPLPTCQFSTNLNFENSFAILMSLAKNHLKFIFEH